jgi:hypothetical protein
MVVAYFNILSRHLPAGTEETKGVSHSRVGSGYYRLTLGRYNKVSL